MLQGVGERRRELSQSNQPSWDWQQKGLRAHTAEFGLCYAVGCRWSEWSAATA